MSDWKLEVDQFVEINCNLFISLVIFIMVGLKKIILIAANHSITDEWNTYVVSVSHKESTLLFYFSVLWLQFFFLNSRANDEFPILIQKIRETRLTIFSHLLRKCDEIWQ